MEKNNETVWLKQSLISESSVIPHKRRNSLTGLEREDAYIEMVINEAERMEEDAIAMNNGAEALRLARVALHYRNYRISLLRKINKKLKSRNRYLEKKSNLNLK